MAQNDDTIAELNDDGTVTYSTAPSSGSIGNYTLATTKLRDNNFNAIVMDESDLYKRALRANGLYTRSDMNWFNVFYRFPRIDPFNALGPTREYIFFTKPDLHIFNERDIGVLNTEIANMPFFQDLMRRGYGKTSLRELQYSVDASTPFVRILSNAKTSNIDLASISVEDMDTAANMYGTKMFYRKASDHSDEENDFTIEFEDSKSIEVYLWFKAFDEYEKKKFEGKVTPPTQEYTVKKVLHDQMTIFKFVVADDGETIVHYSRLQGCYPKSCPREVFSDLSSDGNLKFTTQWKSTFQSDMDPIIITHFNYLSSLCSCEGTVMPLWDPEIQAVSGEDVLVPCISLNKIPNTRYSQYKLLWKK